jgi:hypothetical protein
MHHSFFDMLDSFRPVALHAALQSVSQVSNALLSSCQCTSRNSGPAGPLLSALLSVLQDADTAVTAAVINRTSNALLERQEEGMNHNDGNCTAQPSVKLGCPGRCLRLHASSKLYALYYCVRAIGALHNHTQEPGVPSNRALVTITPAQINQLHFQLCGALLHEPFNLLTNAEK